MRSARIRLCSIAATSVVLLSARAGFAQSADAQTLFGEGERLLASGDIAKACDAFEASNRAEPGAGTLLRLGDCRERNHQLASAWTAYKDALARAKDPRKRAAAEAKVAALEPALSYVTVTVPASIAELAITRDGKPFELALVGRAVPIDGGEHVFAATAPSRLPWQVAVHVPDTDGHVEVTIPELAPRPTPPPGTIWETRRTRAPLALAIAGASVAALGTGIGLGIGADDRRDEAFALCKPMTPCADADRATKLVDSAHSRALAADALFGIAGVAAIAAGLAWWTGVERVPHVELGVTSGGASLSIGGAL